MSPDKIIRNTAFTALAFMPLLLAVTRAGADIALCIIVVMFLLESALRHSWQWLRQPEMKALAALWIFMLLVSPLTPIDHVGSFKAALIWGRFVLFYAAARFWLLPSSEALKKINTIGIPILIFIAFDTAWQYKTGISLTGRPMIDERLTGPLTKANIGNFLLKVGLPMLGMMTYRLMESRQYKRLWLCAAGLLAIVSLVAVSGERSTAVLMLLGIGIIGITMFACQPQARKWVVMAGAGIIALLVTLAMTQPIIQQKAAFFAQQVSDFSHTPYGQLYTAAWRLWQQHPTTGIGAQQFLAACQPEILHVTYCDVHPHNMYFEWLVATGLPGILLFLLAMLLVFRRLMRDAVFSGTASVLAAFALSEFAVLLFPFVVTQSVFSNWSAVLFWYSLSVGMSLPYLSRSPHE